MKEDKVNHPKHYTNGDIEPIDYINGNKMDYLEGNIIKYIDENKDMLETRARKAIKKASEKRNKKKTKSKFGFEYKDRNW